jgi:hypothetical protein
VIPPIPAVPEGEAGDTGTAEIRPRYEDITQDGRVVVTALMQGLGMSVWRAMGKRVPPAAFARDGILPILRRLVLVGDGGPFSVGEKIEYEGTWRFAREKGGERIFLLMWMEARAPNAPTYGPRPDPSAPRVRVGRVFAEHVVTRPFAPPEQRKVTRLPEGIEGIPPLPALEHVFESAESLVEKATLEDAGEVAFGMMHTDSNQHVNSLVYPKKFEEALVGRADPKLLARYAEMRWRKPFFAGERAALRIGGKDREFVGVLSPVGTTKPSCTIAMTLG